MTETERLRQLLDERGVEWWEDAFSSEHRTVFDGKDGVRYCVHQLGSSLFISSVLSVTPEQAVEATLGRGTCRDVCSSVSEFTCSSCGFNCDLTSWISLFDGDEGRHRCHHHGTPNYCPNCGRRVEP